MKILKIAITCILLNSHTEIKSQDIAKMAVKYKLTYVIDTTQPESPDIAYFMLFIGKKMSKYDDYVDEKGGRVYSTQNSGQPIYKDYASNKMIREMPMPQVLYSINGEIPKVEWQIGSDRKKILDYDCQSATGYYRGRTYTAWFSSKIPYRTGPWKLGGLPGLILEMYDEKNQVIWVAENVSTEIEESKKVIQPDKSAIAVTNEEFRKLNDAMRRDPGAARGASTATHLPPGVTVVNIPKTGSGGRKFRTFNNPIEKDL